MADLDIFSRFFVEVSLDRCNGLSAKDRLSFMAYTGLLNAYETTGKAHIKQFGQEIFEGNDPKTITLLYLFDFLLTSSSWGTTYCFSSEDPEQWLLPKLSHTKNPDVIDELSHALEYLKDYGDVVDFPIDPYPEDLLLE